MPQKRIQAEDLVIITKRIQSGSRAKELMEEYSPSWNYLKLPKRHPSKHDHSNDGQSHQANTRVGIDRNAIHYHYPLLSNSFVLIPLDLHTELRSST
jgi:hypothetical protein